MSRDSIPDAAVERVVERTVQIAEIPAPTGSEQRRSALVAEWWRQDGLDEVSVDHAGNVWGRVPAATTSGAPAILVCAHLDTVFDETVVHEVRREGDRLVGPGVGDNAVAVAALSDAFGVALDAATAPIWLVATTGEEGLGNLRGIYAALGGFAGRVGAVVAVEGNYLDRIGIRGVCSERWSVQLSGPGGHSWEAANNASAVHEAAAMVCELSSSVAAGTPRRTVNVGRFEGGDGITTRAPAATMLLDMRAELPEAMPALRQRLIRSANAATARGVGVSLSLLGRRGGGGIDPEHPLVQLAKRAQADVGRPARLVAVSTDANAAYDLGIPAITLGVTEGARQHSTQEWISTRLIGAGMAALVRTVRNFGLHLHRNAQRNGRSEAAPESAVRGGR